MVDRTIPIHARTLGLGVPPHEMGVYCRVVRTYRYEPICMLLVQTSPPLVKTHTSNPAFPTGGGGIVGCGLGGFVFCGSAERRDHPHPLKGGWSHSLPVGDSGDVVFCCLVRCWRGSAGCWGVGVVEGDCCFLVVERFLKGCGELEFVVEGVDGETVLFD